MSQNVGTIPLFSLISQPWTSAPDLGMFLANNPWPERLAATPSECLNLHQDLDPIPAFWLEWGTSWSVENVTLLCMRFCRMHWDGPHNTPVLQSIANKIRLQLGEARDVGSSYLRAFDAVYVDPMYPPKNQRQAPPSSGPIASDDRRRGFGSTRVTFLGSEARQTHGGQKTKACSPALEEAPHHQVESKMVRWDVWLNQPNPT